MCYKISSPDIPRFMALGLWHGVVVYNGVTVVNNLATVVAAVL
jgi:hypothetical protein